MRIWRCALLAVLVPLCSHWASGLKRSGPAIEDVYPNKARYAPHEPVVLTVCIAGAGSPVHATLQVRFWHLEAQVGMVTMPVTLVASDPLHVSMMWIPPLRDYMGYLADVRLLDPNGRELDRSQTAIDVSSEWSRFPRYGYLAHYSKEEGAEPNAWIAKLNKFHIDGLEYYDYQYQHNQPLAGTVARPASEWKDIAGRTVDRDVLLGFLAAAHRDNMMSMAYNSSYSAYVQAFKNDLGVQLRWAVWDSPTAPRTLSTAKSLDLPPGRGWETPRLVYMNQNSPAWQKYLFGKMSDLFRAYSFDGWHIDTFGTEGGYGWSGKYVNFIAGFGSFIDHAKADLHKPIVLNTVNTWGQAGTARSDADFVYSELWEDHETYASILDAAEQVHTINPKMGVVFAAYLQRPPKDEDKPADTSTFNAPGILLADAAIFASGAAHIELGDGSRMLSSEYFPADTKFAVTPELSEKLRHYYDFLTAYENVLRYEVFPAPAAVTIAGQLASPFGVPNTIWTISRQKGDRTIVHFINLMGSEDAHWRDVHADRPPAPVLTGLNVRVAVDADIAGAGWASPDVDGGRYHALQLTRGNDQGQRYVEFVLPSLDYWDMVVLNQRTS